MSEVLQIMIRACSHDLYAFNLISKKILIELSNYIDVFQILQYKNISLYFSHENFTACQYGMQLNIQLVMK